MTENTFWDKMGLKGKKALIVHHDDLGFLHAQDEAFKNLGFQTGSVMMPGTWATAFAGRKDIDLGVHLTLTSEWKSPRIRPLTGGSSLRDSHGYFWSTLESAWANVTPEDAEAEMRAQIESAYNLKIDVTHLDTHMGAVLRPDLAEIYVKLGVEYGLPVYLPVSAAEHSIEEPLLSFFDDIINRFTMPKYRVVDGYSIPPEERRDWYIKKLSELGPGIYHMIHHSALPEADARVLPDWEGRKADYEALMDPGVRKVMKDFTSLTYREIRDNLIKRDPPI